MFPDPSIYIHTYTHTHNKHTHTSCTRLPWVLGSIFSGPLCDPATADATANPSPRPAPEHRTPHDPADRFVYCQPGGERRTISLVFVCVCVSARGDEAAGRPCSHTGSVDGSSSVFRWSSYGVCVSFALTSFHDATRAKININIFLRILRACDSLRVYLCL